jgi:hypothetical protein
MFNFANKILEVRFGLLIARLFVSKAEKSLTKCPILLAKSLIFANCAVVCSVKLNKQLLVSKRFYRYQIKDLVKAKKKKWS